MHIVTQHSAALLLQQNHHTSSGRPVLACDVSKPKLKYAWKPARPEIYICVSLEDPFAGLAFDGSVNRSPDFGMACRPLSGVHQTRSSI